MQPCYTVTVVGYGEMGLSLPDGDTFAVLHHLVHVLHFVTLLGEQVVGPVACVAVGRCMQALCLCGRLMLASLLLHLNRRCQAGGQSVCYAWQRQVQKSVDWVQKVAEGVQKPAGGRRLRQRGVTKTGRSGGCRNWHRGCRNRQRGGAANGREVSTGGWGCRNQQREGQKPGGGGCRNQQRGV